MNKGILRRELLGFGWAVGGFCLGQRVEAGTVEPSQAVAPPFPWRYRQLDVARVKARAYTGYFKGGCMYGVFEAIAGTVAQALGSPYTEFPFELSTYGSGGVAAWGTLCGTCNGAAMAIALFHQGETRTRLIHDVFSWYEGATLPSYLPEAPVRVAKGFSMPSSRPDSVLCHVSIARWTVASGLASSSPERFERCARLVADVAGHVAEALNMAQGQYTPRTSISGVAAGCLACHGEGKHAPKAEVVGRMACIGCHKDAHNQKKQ